MLVPLFTLLGVVVVAFAVGDAMFVADAAAAVGGGNGDT